MFSVIFEVRPKPDQFEEYLGLAKHLKPTLETIDGFVDNERFESQLRSGWILSHSTWRDEKSVVRWRTVGRHHDVQQRGRQQTSPPTPTDRCTNSASTRPRPALRRLRR
jgi:heme-degrading monooxygenase HmoA